MFDGEISVLAAIQLLTACFEIPSFFYKQKYKQTKDGAVNSLSKDMAR